ncbi:MAG: hypothetical protein M3O99_10995 [Chloroflexota bacterium]|nr:hypothetical protein [Chloroflexota bacterium]
MSDHTSACGQPTTGRPCRRDPPVVIRASLVVVLAHPGTRTDADRTTAAKALQRLVTFLPDVHDLIVEALRSRLMG